MNQSNYDLIKKISIFKGLADDKLKILLNSCEEILVHAEEVIIHEGDVGNELYIIKSGEVIVYTHGVNGKEIILAHLGEGRYFGEQALLPGRENKRNSSVKALTETVLIKISRQNFNAVLEKNRQFVLLLRKQGINELFYNLRKKIYPFISLLKKESILKLPKKADEKELDRNAILNHLFEKIGFPPDKDDIEKIQILKVNSGEVLFKEGEVATNVYYLLDGVIELSLFETEADKEKEIVLIQKGQLFGEIGVLENKIRAGSAKAIEDSAVVVIPDKIFKSIYDTSNSLKKYIESLSTIYQLPRRGNISQFTDAYEGISTTNSIYKLSDGRIYVAINAIHEPLFLMLGDESTNADEVIYKKENFLYLKLFFLNEKIVGIESYGYWDDLPKCIAYVLDQTPINKEQQDIFSKTGTLRSISEVSSKIIVEDDAKIICECMGISLGKLKAVIKSGILDLNEISQKTGAGTVCGCCKPKITALIGEESWFNASLHFYKEFNHLIRAYHIRSLAGKLPSFKSGQHIILQMLVGDKLFERSYTITSLSENNDYYEIAIKLESKGVVTKWIFEQNDPILFLKISKPQGEVIFNPNDIQPAIVFVAGIGLTPVIAYARELLNTQSKRHLHLDYSVLSKDLIAYSNELNDFSKHENITVNIRVTNEQGMLDKDAISNIVNQYNNPKIYICGPEPYNDFVKNTLLELGIPVEAIFIEKFYYK